MAAVTPLPLPAVDRRGAGTVATVVNGEASDRGPHGRFEVGNRAASGNPHHRAVCARRKALLAAVSDDDVAAVARKLRDEALAGGMAGIAAAKVLLTFVCGRAAPAPDPDDQDADEVRRRLRWPCVVEVLLAALDTMPPVAALAFIRGAAGRLQRGIDRPIDTGRAALLDAFREQVLAGRAGK
jgi:hypothetical protein